MINTTKDVANCESNGDCNIDRVGYVVIGFILAILGYSIIKYWELILR